MRVSSLNTGGGARLPTPSTLQQQQHQQQGTRRCGGGSRRRRLQCEAATPAADGNSNSNSSSSSSSRYTRPLKQALPGYVVNDDDSTPSNGSGSAAAAASLSSSSSHSTAATTTTTTSKSSTTTPTSNKTTTTTTTIAEIERGSWEWWSAYFNAMDDTVRELDGVDEELHVAVQEEDYEKAAALRVHQKRLEASDCVTRVLEDLKLAVKEERYGDAAQLRDVGGVGMLGWWAGRGEGDPHGHVVNVSADFGRYVAHAYTGTNLAELAGLTEEHSSSSSSTNSSSSGNGNGNALQVTSSNDVGGPLRENSSSSSSSSSSSGIGMEGGEGDPGAPVFELFIRQDPDGQMGAAALLQQATALHAPASALASPAIMDDLADLLAQKVGDGANVSIERGKDEDGIGFVKINVTGVAGGDNGEDDDGVVIGGRGVLDDDDDGVETIDDLMKLIEAQEKKELDAAEDEDGVVSSSDEDDSSEDDDDDRVRGSMVMPADEMVDAWVEIDGRLKKMKLEELVADVVEKAQRDGGDGDGDGDVVNNNNNSTSSSSEDDASRRKTSSNKKNNNNKKKKKSEELGDTLSEMGLGVVAQRVPATIEWHDRDSFTFIVAEDLKVKESTAGGGGGARNDSNVGGATAANVAVVGDENKTEKSDQKSSIDKAAAAAKKSKRQQQGKSPVFAERLDEIESIVRSAMGAAIAQGIGATSIGNPDDGILGLSGRVAYTRLPMNDPSTDVFTGVYIGSFGPHGPEILRVARAMIEGEEWVQGTKLTGDPNVPAGKVSFRARIGRSHRLSPSGAYPPEYGVMQRYKGQGRVAREGYSAAKWVDGELLTFSAANPMTRGAELGFVFNIDAARKYLLLFTKVKLDKLMSAQQQHDAGF